MPEPDVTSPSLYRAGWCGVLMLLCVLAAPATSASEAEYRLVVTFDLPGGRVLGEADIRPDHPGRMAIPRGNIIWKRVEVDGKVISLPLAGQETVTLSVRQRVRIRYEAVFPLEGEEQVSPSGIALSGEWYPVVPGSFHYRLTARLPSSWEAVSEADRIRRRALADGVEYHFDFPHQLPQDEGISLAASDHFVIRHGKYRDIDLYTYFLPEDTDQSTRFLKQAAAYLARFERQLGPYPYRRFSMVEHPPAGAHSLPTYVVLGGDENRAERWEDTALDHEIAHQWLGNTIFTDYGGGNWNEGLTLYVADYLSAEASGEGWKCRRRMLAGYGNNIFDNKGYPLERFQEREDRASKYIGYAKAGMVFHMLRRELGDARFFAGLKRFATQNRFRIASWKDLERAFASKNAPSLAPFFAQWLHRADAPVLALSSVHASPVSQGYRLEFTLSQSTPPYDLSVPVNIRFADGSSARQTIHLDGTSLTVRRTLAKQPAEVVVDEDFELFRALYEPEYPPTIERLLTRKKIGIVFGAQGAELYTPLVESLAGLQVQVMANQLGDTAFRFGGRGGQQQPARRLWQALNFAALADESVSPPDSIIVLGNNNPAAARLFSQKEFPQADFALSVALHPHNPGRLVALAHASSEAAVRAAVQALPDLWCLTSVAMKAGRVIVRQEGDAQRGVRAQVLQ